MKIGAVVEQTPEWERTWTGLAQVGDLSRREVEIIADTARRGIAANFERESAPDGTPWHPLAPQTRRQRAEGIDERGVPFRVGQAHPILVRTRDLKRSLVDPRHPRNVTEVLQGGGITHIALGADDDPLTPHRISILHGGGRTRTGGLVPPRPFMGLSGEATGQVEEQTARVVCQRVERL